MIHFLPLVRGALLWVGLFRSAMERSGLEGTKACLPALVAV